MRRTLGCVAECLARQDFARAGKTDLKHAVAAQLAERSGIHYDPETQIVITCGEGDAMVDALFVATDPGDEVILPDPTYAGVINRVSCRVATGRYCGVSAVDGVNVRAPPAGAHA